MDEAAARAPKPGPYRFKPRRQKEGGRRIGSTNKVPRLLKEAIMLAAELEGSNGWGSGKLVGFFRKVAREDPRAFAKLLARVPLQEEVPTTEVVRYRTSAEIRRDMISRGLTKDVLARMVENFDDDGVELVYVKSGHNP